MDERREEEHAVLKEQEQRQAKFGSLPPETVRRWQVDPAELLSAPLSLKPNRHAPTPC